MLAMRAKRGIPITTAPMEARSADELPDGPGWQFEPKWDGFRCLAFRNGDKVDLRAKSGKPLGRYFPEVIAALRKAKQRRFVIDGELVIVADGHLSFEALQMRLHPAASRIARLSRETPATLIAFDMLLTARGKDLRALPLMQRRAALEAFVAAARVPDLSLSGYTRKRAMALKWLEGAGGDVDGVVAKLLDGPYLAGERAMVKVKKRRSADCVVGGFRYLRNSTLVGSLLLGLYNAQGLLDHVGFTSTIADADRPALTRKLKRLIAPPGFTGDRPDRPSRWSSERTTQWLPLRSKLVVEVLYDHVSGARFRHGTRLLRWRPDKAPRQCTFEQIKPQRRAPLRQRLTRGSAIVSTARPR
jgi:ATP-dependent DNA ligase